MAYTLNQGIGSNDGPDRLQRGWLLGLPVLILALIIAAIINRHSSTPGTGTNAQLIPLVSAAKTDASGGSKGKNSNDKNANGNSTTSSNLSASASAQPAGGSSLLGFSSVSPGTASSSPASGTIGGTGGVVGGMGGGPTSGGSTGGTGGSGGTTLPDCTIGQIATVSCQVPACTPAVNLAPGQKVILGVNGTCIVIN